MFRLLVVLLLCCNVAFAGTIHIDDMLDDEYGVSRADMIDLGDYTQTLTNDSMADALHRHSELSASDGSPNPAVSVDTGGKVSIGTIAPVAGYNLIVDGNIYLSNTGQALTFARSGLESWSIYHSLVGSYGLGFYNIADAEYRLFLSEGGNVGFGTTSPSQQLEITGDFELPYTTHADESGIIYKGDYQFIHNFEYGSNGTTTPVGRNTFVGVGSGNFTAGSTATNAWEASNSAMFGFNSGAALTTGFDNTGLGSYALNGVTSGPLNTGAGSGALMAVTTGGYNTGIGGTSLYYTTTSNFNTGLGFAAGAYLTDGTSQNTGPDSCVYLGSRTKASAVSQSNEIVIGESAIGQGSNTIMLGNSSVTGLYCYETSISSPSDIRVKKDITSIDPNAALSFINDIRPVTYHRKNQADWDDEIKDARFKNKIIKIKRPKWIETEIDLDALPDKEVTIEVSKEATEIEKKAARKVLPEKALLKDGKYVIKEVTGVEVDEFIPAEERPENNPNLYPGMIAQEIAAAMEDHNISADLVATNEQTGLMALKYGNFTPYIIAAIKAQQNRIETLESAVQTLKADRDNILSRLEALENPVVKEVVK